MSSKKTILSGFRDQLREFEDEIDRLDKKSRAFDKKLKQEFERHSGDFREILDDGKINVERLKELTEVEFDRLKGNVEFTAKALKKAFDVFFDQFKDRETTKSESD